MAISAQPLSYAALVIATDNDTGESARADLQIVQDLPEGEGREDTGTPLQLPLTFYILMLPRQDGGTATGAGGGGSWVRRLLQMASRLQGGVSTWCTAQQLREWVDGVRNAGGIQQGLSRASRGRPDKWTAPVRRVEPRGGGRLFLVGCGWLSRGEIRGVCSGGW